MGSFDKIESIDYRRCHPEAIWDGAIEITLRDLFTPCLIDTYHCDRILIVWGNDKYSRTPKTHYGTTIWAVQDMDSTDADVEPIENRVNSWNGVVCVTKAFKYVQEEII